MWVCALIISLVALGILASENTKRRRTFGLAPIEHPFPAWGCWFLVLFPGFVLMMLGDWAGFVLWLAAVTSFGWLLILPSPGAARTWFASLRARAIDLQNSIAPVSTNSDTPAQSDVSKSKQPIPPEVP